MKGFSSRRRVIIAAIAVVLILFLVRPGVTRLKARIATSISRAVERRVEIGSVQLRFLPRPGFDVQNLVIDEDPAFGSEPMLRAPEVTAVVRLTSLIRGRLDVSRLDLTEPSLNLVRENGHWNLEALLEHAARTATAPTGKSKAEVRPGFPYIEASSGRINFKAGAEKKPYALLDADFALWQESENTWGTRLKAQPLRTDLNLNDAGVLTINGTWQRAPSLGRTPLQFELDWTHAPLGQLTKLISGKDRGWRGAVSLNATLNGTPEALLIGTDATIDDFHRYDISSVGGMRLRGHCDARYSSTEEIAHQIFCAMPVGNGMMTLHGDAGLPGVHRADLALDLENVPVSAAAQLAMRAKKNLPADLVATGSVQGDFVAKEDVSSKQRLQLQGQGEIKDFRLRSVSNKVDLAPGTVPFLLVSNQRKGVKSQSYMDGYVSVRDGLRLEYGPFQISLGQTATQANGWFAWSGYGLVIRGQGEVSRTLRAASLLGLPVLKANLEGLAQMDLLVSGSWASNFSRPSDGFSPPELTGTVQLHNLRAILHGVNGPLDISSAQLHISPEETRVDKLNARAANARWTGTASWPRDCGTPGACLLSFNLKTEQVGLNGLHDWLRSPSTERRWYEVLASENAAPSFLQSLRATGKISADKVLIHNIAASKVSASLAIDRGHLSISALRADVLGGRHSGNWHIDFASGPLVYSGSGTLTAISLGQLADAMGDGWISGTANGDYQIKASAADSSLFWKSAEGAVQFKVWDGVLAHIVLNGDDSPLHVAQGRGLARLHDGKVEIDKGMLVSPTGSYEISGSASLGHTLDFKLTQANQPNAEHAGLVTYSITGTIGQPHISVIPAPQTQAQLKP